MNGFKYFLSLHSCIIPILFLVRTNWLVHILPLVLTLDVFCILVKNIASRYLVCSWSILILSQFAPCLVLYAVLKTPYSLFFLPSRLDMCDFYMYYNSS